MFTKNRLFSFVVSLLIAAYPCCAASKTPSSHIEVSTSDRVVANQKVAVEIQNYFQNIPFIDMGFSLPEVLLALKQKPTLKETFDKNAGYLRECLCDKQQSAYVKLEINWFKKCLYSHKELENEYAVQYKFLNQLFPDTFVLDSLPTSHVSTVIKNAAGSGGASEASTAALDMFFLSGERMIKIAQSTAENRKNFESWLNALQKSGIFSPVTPSAILEKKKSAILSKYHSSDNDLMKIALDAIRNAEVQVID